MSEILLQAIKQMETCLEYRQPRLDQIKKYEDDYAHKVKPALKGRFNIPLPIVSGFTKTLMSKIDDGIKVRFLPGRESKLKSAKKVSSMWEKDSASDRGNYNGADMDAKKLAIFGGFVGLKLIGQNSPYQQKLEAVDYHDIIFEPLGGADLDNHLFKGQLNIWKTEAQLKEGAMMGVYDKEAVARLIISQRKFKEEAEWQRKNKINRFLAMRIDPTNYGYVGNPVYNLTWMITKNKAGKDVYVLFDYFHKIAIEEKPVEEKFADGRNPLTIWHTERNPVNFMSQSPLDDIYPAAEAMRILINGSFDNINRRNWDMVAYDMRKILNPRDLSYRPNGAIPVKLEEGQGINNALMKLQTPDTTNITINLATWLNSFLGEKTGVTPGAQGLGEEDKVGIFFGNLEQVADRFGLLNKFYKEAHIKVTKIYLSNLKKYFPKGEMVKYTGIKGINEEELRKDDLSGLDIDVISPSSEEATSRNKQVARKEAMSIILSNERLAEKVSDEFLLNEILRTGEFEEDEIKSATSKEGSANADLMSEAAQSIEIILEGKSPKLNQSANFAFIRKIMDYATEKADDLDDNQYIAMMDYARRHFIVAQRNVGILAEANQQVVNQAKEVLPDEERQPLPNQL